MTILKNSPIVIMVSGSYLPDIGGLETHLSDLFRLLSNRGFSVVLVTFQPYQKRARMRLIERENRQITIIRLPILLRTILLSGNKWTTIGKLLHQPLICLAAYACCLTYRDRLIALHAHGITSTPLVALMCKALKVRTVLSIHYQWEIGRNHGVFYKMLFRLFNVILTLSAKEHGIVSQIEGLKQVLPFRYWIDLEVFKPTDPTPFRQREGLSDHFVVLFVGRLIEEKGVRLFTQLAESYSANRNLIFLMIGVGPLEKFVINEASRISNLRYIGPKSNDEMPRWYSASNLLLVPSIVEEGFGRVIAESLACGTPVVASNIGGIPEALNTDVGILVDPSFEGFKNAIDYIINSPQALQSLRTRCRSYAESTYNESNGNVIVESYSNS